MEFTTATIVCSLINFAAIEDGKWVNASAEDLNLTKAPYVIKFPEREELISMDNGSFLWRTGDELNSLVTRVYDPEAMSLTTIYSYATQEDTIVTVHAHRECIEVE